MKSMALAVALVCAMAASASAKDLGERGAKSINGSFQLELKNTKAEGSDKSTTAITVAPSVDLFVAPNVSLGGGFLVRYSKTGDIKNTDIGLEARVGYYLPIGSLGLWLLVGGVYLHETTDVPGDSFDTTENTLALKLYLPLVFHLAPNFFFGLGPIATQEVVVSDGDDIDANDRAKERVLGITAIVGGAW